MMKTSIHTVNSKSMVIDNGVIVKDENIKAIYDEVNDNLALEATINGNTYYKKLGMDGIINLLNNPSSPLSLEERLSKDFPGIGIEKLSKNVSLIIILKIIRYIINILIDVNNIYEKR